MAYFPEGYNSAMDRGYASIAPKEQRSYSSSPEGEMTELGLSPGNIGISAPPFGDQLQALRAKIFQGPKIVELGFMGRGKGSMQGGNTTPEMFGADERRDIRELAKWNKVTLSVHATPNAGSLAGFAQNQFDDSAREGTFNEIRRAIDFAADTTEGGPVVVHAQEFPRAILDEYPEFKAYPDEHEKAVKHLVDVRTGQVIPLRKTEFTYEPVYEEVDGKWKTITGELIDKNFVPKSREEFEKLFNRIPKPNDERGYETQRVGWEEFEKRANEFNKNKAAHEPAITPEEMFYRSQMQNQILQSKGASAFYNLQLGNSKDAYEDVMKALAFYQKLEARNDLTEDERRALMVQNQFDRYVPPRTVKISEHLKETAEGFKDRMRNAYQASAAAEVQARQIGENIDNVKTIKSYAVDKTAETISRAAIYAMERERQVRQSARGNEAMEGPLYIAIENFFPEVYGGHPQEIREIIERSREAMTKTLIRDKHMSEKEAIKQAEDHIKATWDTGHANIWRKYFQPKGNETPEQTDKRFKEWYLKEAEDLAKRKMIGNVHVSDNFGWEDEHVTPGQGITPIKEFIEVVKKHGVKNVIVEPAHQDVRALRGALGLFGAGVYGLPGGQRDTWADIEHSYFGRTAPPYFLYGESAPRADEWSFWSATPLE